MSSCISRREGADGSHTGAELPQYFALGVHRGMLLHALMLGWPQDSSTLQSLQRLRLLDGDLRTRHIGTCSAALYAISLRSCRLLDGSAQLSCR